MTRGRRTLASTSAVVVFLVGATLAVVSPATAGHGGQLTPPNDRIHRIDRVDLTSGSKTAVDWGIHELDRTVMDATLTGSGDVEVYDAYYGTTGEWEDVAGKATCMGYTNFYQTCTLYLVRFNLSYTANYSTSKRHSLGCHEFGHTVTLGHRTSSNDTDNNSCMRSVISSLRPDFDAHDISAVNDNN